ncbi:WD40 repeat domain-containing protein [Lignipirellula cremea]|uniref:WD domain, G-beta repeat n=1 Tax=Lignipirellula cremea TaxID=2528010 RepID=A0A518E4V2_9BACT|nr:WD40 repeat domain-containing protein [Lignipirellula cremea]QDU99112.1 WD domain, G-beta repeat [Lignipirellula cremea]
MSDSPAYDKATLAWELPWQDDWVTACTFVGPQRKLAAGNRRGDILLWDLPAEPGAERPLPVRRLEGHTNEITRLVATPDGKTLISASYDHTIRFWDMNAPGAGTAEIILDASDRAAVVKKLGAKAPPPEPGVQVATQTASQVLTGHPDWIVGLSLSGDGRTLLSGDDAGNVIVWDTASAQERRRWQVTRWVFGMALSPDGQTALVAERFPLVFTPADHHRGAKLWDVATGEVLHDLTKLLDKVYIGAAAFSPDGKLLALGQGNETSKGKLFLIDPATGEQIRELAGHAPGGVHDVRFSADGKTLFSCGRDTMLRVWNVEDGQQLAEVGKPRGGQFKDIWHALGLSADEHWLAAADMSGLVAVYHA